jgi:hypothetical protein
LIHDPAVIRRIFEYLGLAVEPSALLPARDPPLVSEDAARTTPGMPESVQGYGLFCHAGRVPLARHLRGRPPINRASADPIMGPVAEFSDLGGCPASKKGATVDSGRALTRAIGGMNRGFRQLAERAEQPGLQEFLQSVASCRRGTLRPAI